MRLLQRWLVLAGLSLMMSACSSMATTEKAAIPSDVQPLLVVIKDSRGEQKRHAIPGPGYQPTMAYQNDPALARLTEKIARHYQLTVFQQWPIRSLRLHCFLIAPPQAETLKQLENDPDVLWVQPFNEYSVQSSKKYPQYDEIKRYFDHSHQDVTDVSVAVIDTGLDREHPALQGSELSYFDFVGERSDMPSHQEKHGLAVTGLMAAQPAKPTNNQSGAVAGLVTGLIYQADFYHLRGCWQVSDGGGRCNTLTLALALDKAAELQPDILNLSLTGPEDRVLTELSQHLQQQGTLIISAYDEHRSAQQRFPTPGNGVLYISGVSTDLSELSRQHPNVITAPRSALSLAPDQGYDVISGHSIATPHISAVAARVMSLHPELNRNQVVEKIRRWSGRYFSEQEPPDKTLTHKRYSDEK
ncbi:S8 family peptidase [Bacterioplanoides sp.]|uniref:S8 family peptidase n=1 Tax=Bacterioplanoides sp. TaxID=2066072 RepID=UPI003B00D53E